LFVIPHWNVGVISAALCTMQRACYVMICPYVNYKNCSSCRRCVFANEIRKWLSMNKQIYSYFSMISLFKKLKVGWCNLHPVCASVYVSMYPHLSAFEHLNQTLWKSVMYIMGPESISVASYINPSHQSLCLYVYYLYRFQQRLSIHVPPARNIRNGRIIGRVVFYAVRVISKEGLCIPLK
jgi:hypothetical protein